MLLKTVVFYILTFLFTFLLGGLQQATGINPNLSIPQLGPGIAAWVSILLFRKTVIRPNTSLKTLSLKDILLSVLLPFGAALIVLFFTRQFVTYDAGPMRFSWLLFLWIPMGALGEELGWRGFLQANLDHKLSGWLSCLVVGLLWTPFHVQNFQNGALYMLFFAILLIAMTTVLYMLMRRTQFNLWIAMLFHAAINYANLLYYNALPQVAFMMINALVWAILAVGIILLNREMFFTRKA